MRPTSLLYIILLFLTACTENIFPLNSPETGFYNSLPPGSTVEFLGKQSTGATAILFIHANIASNPERDIPAFQNMTGIVYMEHDGQTWKPLYSHYGVIEANPPAPAVINDRIHEIVGTRGNTVQLIEGRVFASEITVIEAQIANGEILRIAPIAGLYAMVAPDEIGFCSIKALDVTGAVRQF